MGQHSRGPAALPGQPSLALPRPADTGCSWPLPSQPSPPCCWQVAVTRCPLCVLGKGAGGGGGRFLQGFLLLSHSCLPGSGDRRVAGDWPGNMEPKTLEMTSGNPFLKLVGKTRLRDRKGLPHAILGTNVTMRHPLWQSVGAQARCVILLGISLFPRIGQVCLCHVHVHTHSCVSSCSGCRRGSVSLCVSVSVCWLFWVPMPSPSSIYSLSPIAQPLSSAS